MKQFSDTESVYSLATTVASNTSKRKGRRRRRAKTSEGYKLFDIETGKRGEPITLARRRNQSNKRNNNHYTEVIKRKYQHGRDLGTGSSKRSFVSGYSGVTRSRRDSVSTTTSTKSFAKSEIGPFQNDKSNGNLNASENFSESELESEIEQEETNERVNVGMTEFEIMSPLGRLNEDEKKEEEEEEKLLDDEIDEVDPTISTSTGIDKFSRLGETDFEINLNETNTILLFDNFQTSVHQNDDNIEKISNEISRFWVQSKRRKEENHLFFERGCQTVSIFKKNKFSDKKSTETEEISVQAKEYEIFDEYELIRKREEELEDLSLMEDIEKENEDEEEGEIGEDEEGIEESLDSTQVDLMNSNELLKAISVMERLTVFNTHHKVISDYLEEYSVDYEKDIDLEHLWTTKYETTGYALNDLKFSTGSDTIMGASYIGKEEGYILCWDLKNLLHPERKYFIPKKSPLCIDFSIDHPNLLAAGFNDGTVAIFDLRSRSSAPSLQSSESHQNNVWSLKFVRNLKSTGGASKESLYSLGVDGRVNHWSILKGLQSTQINRLKKVGNSKPGIVSRETGGLAFDFNPLNPSNYIVGTEDGLIYKFSTSYNDQYLVCNNAHNGPVYNVLWNPINPKKYISCSTDWTVKLWSDVDVNEEGHELTIEPYLNKSEKRSNCIVDIDWCKTDENVFGFIDVTKDVEIWNLKKNVLKPILTKKLNKNPTKILFTKRNSVLIGSANGDLDIFRIRNVEKIEKVEETFVEEEKKEAPSNNEEQETETENDIEK